MKKYLSVVLPILLLFFAQSNILAQTPSIADGDLKSLIITMRQENKTGCTNCAADYSVTIRGDGTVNYAGTANVKRIGEKSYTIPIEQVKRLVREFETVNYFDFNSEYVSRDNGDGTFTSIDHGAPLTTSISIDGRYKKVYDFHFAPEKLKSLEQKIYEISLVEQFLKPKDTPRSD